MTDTTTQLELFDALRPAASRPRRAFHIGMLSLRYDHLVLVVLMGLVSSSVVFALGVERGKRVARAERPLLTAPPSGVPAKAPAADSRGTGKSASAPSSKDSAPAASKQKSPAAPASKPRKTALKVVKAQPQAGASKFAIQVVAYRQPTRAQQELQRLQQRGERAFLLKKSDRVAVLVGPFPSKANAVSKLVGLKSRYQDCFVKSL